MKFTYKYRGVSFSVPFDAWRRLMWIWLCLHFRRLCRLIKRTCLSMKSLTLVIIIAILFTFITGFIGVAIAEYTVWYETFWDLRLFYCTSIIICATSAVTNQHLKHHKALKEQEYEYFEFMHLSYCFIHNVLSLLGVKITEKIFLTSEFLSKASDQIKRATAALSKEELLNSHCSPVKFRGQASPTDSFIFYLTEFLRVVENTKKYANRLVNESEYKYFSNTCEYACQTLREEIFLIQSTIKNEIPVFSIDVLNFIDTISRQVYIIIAVLRRPWRYELDWSLDNQQHNILSNYDVTDGKSFNPLEYWR